MREYPLRALVLWNSHGNQGLVRRYHRCVFPREEYVPK